jgi:hypothetical protein
MEKLRWANKQELSDLETKLVESIVNIEEAEGREIIQITVSSEYREKVGHSFGQIEYQIVNDGNLITQKEVKYLESEFIKK